MHKHTHTNNKIKALNLTKEKIHSLISGVPLCIGKPIITLGSRYKLPALAQERLAKAEPAQSAAGKKPALPRVPLPQGKLQGEWATTSLSPFPTAAATSSQPLA